MSQPGDSLTSQALALKYRTEDALRDPRALLLPVHIRQLFIDQAKLLISLAHAVETKWVKKHV